MHDDQIYVATFFTSEMDKVRQIIYFGNEMFLLLQSIPQNQMMQSAKAQELDPYSLTFGSKFHYTIQIETISNLLQSQQIQCAEKAFKSTNWSYNAGEIYSWCQFHQHFTCAFFVRKSFKAAFLQISLGLIFFGKRKLAQKLLV